MDQSNGGNNTTGLPPIRRNLTTKESRTFWAVIDKIIESRDPNRPIVKIGDPYLDSYKDVSPSLISD